MSNDVALQRNSLSSISSRHGRSVIEELQDSGAEQPFLDVISSTTDTAVRPDDTSSVRQSLSMIGNLAESAIISYHYREKQHRLPTILTDCAVMIAPMALIALVIAVWTLDSQTVDSVPLDAWRNVVTVMATLYPIFFAAIAGRMTSAAAHWKLEKGTTIRSAEILHGSRTVGGTILTLFQMRHINILGLVLFILWAASPLGSQSLLRMISTQLENEFHNMTITYSDPDAPLTLTWANPNTVGGPLRSFALTSTYTTLLLGPRSSKLSPMDLWGNIKIPVLDHGIGQVSDGHESWTAVSNSESEIQYASLLGVPLRIPTVPGNMTFSIESNYVRLKCSNTSVYDSMHVLQPIRPLAQELTVGPPIITAVNGTWQGRNESFLQDGMQYGGSSLWNVALDRFVDQFWLDSGAAGIPDMRNETGIKALPTRLLFQVPSRVGRTVSFPNAFETTCQVTQAYVESRVHCSSAVASPKNCSVIAQRNSRQRHAPENISWLSFPDAFNVLSSELPRLMIGVDAGSPGEISLQYLVDPFIEHLFDMKDLDFSAMNPRLFSQRLEQIFNTYMMINQLSPSGTTGRVNDEAAIEFETQRAELVEHVTISTTWAVLSLLSSLVLLLCSAIGVLLTHLLQGPDILGYVSTVIRDSKYIHLEPKMTWFNGLDLTKAMAETRLQLSITDFSEGQVPIIGVTRIKEE